MTIRDIKRPSSGSSALLPIDLRGCSLPSARIFSGLCCNPGIRESYAVAGGGVCQEYRRSRHVGPIGFPAACGYIVRCDAGGMVEGPDTGVSWQAVRVKSPEHPIACSRPE